MTNPSTIFVLFAVGAALCLSALLSLTPVRRLRFDPEHERSRFLLILLGAFLMSPAISMFLNGEIL